jgi:hypothetical protein
VQGQVLAEKGNYRLTRGREIEIKSRVDARFDEFSANELLAADPKSLMFGLGWVPPLTADERDLVRSYAR